jgi:hypothetical protein
MIEHFPDLKRVWSIPRLSHHESLMVLSQSFLGVTTAGVNFNLLMLPQSANCIKHPNIPPCRR